MVLRRTCKRKRDITNVFRSMSVLVIRLDRLFRSREFRQLLAAVTPFIPMLLHIVGRHWGH